MISAEKLLRDTTARAASVAPKEIEKFSAMAAEWWDPAGKFRPLHRLNPTRIGFIRDALVEHFGGDAREPRPLAGLRLLDVGCGGGLLCEPMARLGAEVIGIDAAARNIEVAQLHAEDVGLAIDYRHTTAEDLAATGESFDVVLSMEVIEHVADLGSFSRACAALLKDDGIMLLSTLNRTLKAYLLAVVGAEYLLRWLPRGTHDWNRFVRPSELAAELRRNGLRLAELKGMVYNPLNETWRLSDSDLDVNYLALATKRD